MGNRFSSNHVKTRDGANEWRLVCGVCLAVLVFGLPTLHYPFRRDHGEFAATAQVILDGGIPYRDVWNPKPPAVLYLYAAIIKVAGPHMMALRGADLIAAMITAALLTRMGRRLWGATGGAVAGLGYGALYFANRAEDLAQNDGFMMVAMVISVSLLWKSRARTPHIWLMMAGLACGWAVAFKYPTGLWALFLFLWLLFDRQCDNRERLVAGLFFAIGGLVVWSVIGGYLLAHGALMDLWESIIATTGYTQLGISSNAWVFFLVGLRYFFIDHQFGPMMLALGSLAVWPSAGGRKARYSFLWGWLMVSTAMVCVQFKFYDYHWLPVLPPLALLMGGGTLALRDLLGWLLERMGSKGGQKTAIWLASGLVLGYLVFRVISYPWLVGHGWRCLASDETAYLARFSGEQDDYPVNLEVARYVAARSSAEDTLFIWGFEPVVYVLSDRRPATRFIYNYPLVGDWYPSRWRDQTVAQLRQSPPAFILVLENDSLSSVTGKNTDSATQLQDYGPLLQVIEEGYVLEKKIGNFQIYHRIE